MTEASGSKAGAEVNLTRIFVAPRELVWRAWTEPEHLMKWWGPAKFTSPAAKIDFRVGGTFLFCMRSANGQDFWNTGVYQEIVPLERIIYTDSFADPEGNRVDPSYYGMPGDWSGEMLVTVTFEEHEGTTKISLRHVGLPAGMMIEMAAAGWNESLDKLAASLS